MLARLTLSVLLLIVCLINVWSLWRIRLRSKHHLDPPPRLRPDALPLRPPRLPLVLQHRTFVVRCGPPYCAPASSCRCSAAYVSAVAVVTAIKALYPTGAIRGKPAAYTYCFRVYIPQSPLTLIQSEVALGVVVVAHNFVHVRGTLLDPVREMSVRGDLSMFMESVPCSIHRVQPDVGILSGPQAAVSQRLVAGRATCIGNSIVCVDPRYPRCSSIAGAVVYCLSIEGSD